MKRRSSHVFAVVVFVIVTAQLPLAQTNGCPDCIVDRAAMPGHGAASGDPALVTGQNTWTGTPSSSDSRRVITVRIDSSWESSPGQTDSQIWNATVCGLVQWNTATDSSGNKTDYFFKLDQSDMSADITIIKGTVSGGFAEAYATNGGIQGPPYTIKMHHNQGSSTAADLCGRIAHEVGHPSGLKNVSDSGCSPSIMQGANATGNNVTNNLQANDVAQVRRNQSAQSTCLGSLGSSTQGCEGVAPDASCTCTLSGSWDCGYTTCSPVVNDNGSRCSQWDDSGCFCYFYGDASSPIIIPLSQDNRIQLTPPSAGVWFDLKALGTPIRTAWTAADSDLGLLFLDRNGNGAVDDGSELFGNHTPLPNGETAKQGFEALAVFDQPAHGGNGDGWIDSRDAIWSSLRVWVDSSHDGISQPTEISSLEGVNISAISIEFISVMRRDAYGNTLRYKAKAIVEGSVRWAHDVFFLTGESYSTANHRLMKGDSLRSTVATFFRPKIESACALAARVR
jgi:hypothetical protein